MAQWDDKEPDHADLREKVERGIFLFLRYFFPAVGPMFIYILCELICIGAGAFIINNGISADEFVKEKINVYTTLGVILTFFILRRGSKKSGSGFFEDASLYRTDVKPGTVLLSFLFGVGAALALSSFISLLPAVGPVTEYKESVSHIYERWSVLLGMLFTTFFTPLVEEVIFRGYMLNRLLPYWGEKWSLFAVSFVFAVMHGTSIWILYAFIMALVLGKISIMEDNILYAVIMHIGFNLPAAVLWFIYLTVRGAKEALAGNKLLIFLLGAAGSAVAAAAAAVYRKKRRSATVW